MRSDLNFYYTVSTETEILYIRRVILYFLDIYIVNEYRYDDFIYVIGVQAKIGDIRQFILSLLNISFVNLHHFV